MRVLVTGASSRLGIAVVQLLVDRGDQVVTLQRRPRTADAVAGGTLPEVEQRLADIGDGPAVAAAATGCDGIVHLAARVGVLGTRSEFIETNVGGTANVVAAARAHGVARLVYISSPSVAHGGDAIVGAGAEPPVVGRTHGWYAESKALAEIEALAANSPSLGVVSLRPHLVWGPGDTQLVGRIVERARAKRLTLVGTGAALVDTTYVDNAATAIVAGLDRVQPGARCAGRTYVISNGEPRPIRDLVAGICDAAGVEFAPRNVGFRTARALGAVAERVWPYLPAAWREGDDEPPITRFVAEQLGTAHWFDPRPVEQDLDWQPKISIDEGLALLAASFRSTQN